MTTAGPPSLPLLLHTRIVVSVFEHGLLAAHYVHEAHTGGSSSATLTWRGTREQHPGEIFIDAGAGAVCRNSRPSPNTFPHDRRPRNTQPTTNTTKTTTAGFLSFSLVFLRQR